MANPKRITVLDEQTANQIAAGEVVERPASIVKELVENAIDAGSRRITVELGDGGVSLIRIIDDGSGIRADEVSLAVCRHATSKISQAADLAHLATLGFRGEALPSIAAVSRLEIRTRTPDSPGGVALVSTGGTTRSESEAGCPVGTRVTVTDLFYNTPARRAFLKSPATEGAYASDILTRLALAHPEIAFQLLNNGHLTLQTTGNGRQIEVIGAIYGKEIARRMLSVEYRGEQMGLSGWVSPPVISRASRNTFSFFVNQRYIRSKVLSDALLEAYHTLLPLHRFPIAVLNLEMDPAAVDVNVHPAKMEVRFHAENSVYGQVLQAVRDALRAGNLIPEVRRPAGPGLPSANFGTPAPEQTRLPAPPSAPKPGGASPVPADARTPDPTSWAAEPSAPEPAAQEAALAYRELPAEPASAAFPDLTVIGQILNTYLVAHSPEGLYVVDQHAAQERINYERMLASRSRAEQYSQPLLVPVVLEMTPPEKEILRDHLDRFAAAGFQLEPFGGSTWLLRQVPTVLVGVSLERVMHEILAALLQPPHLPRQSQLLEDMIIMAACKASIKANERLNQGEAESLLRQLAATEQPYTCPHGRPTLITFTAAELEKQFKRV